MEIFYEKLIKIFSKSLKVIVPYCLILFMISLAFWQTDKVYLLKLREALGNGFEGPNIFIRKSFYFWSRLIIFEPPGRIFFSSYFYYD